MTKKLLKAVSTVQRWTVYICGSWWQRSLLRCRLVNGEYNFWTGCCVWEDCLWGWHSGEGGHTTHTHTESKEPFYGASTKGLFAQWPFALQQGVAGTLGLELGHKHQTAEQRVVEVHACQSVLMWYGRIRCQAQSEAEVKINCFALTFVRELQWDKQRRILSCKLHHLTSPIIVVRH